MEEKRIGTWIDGKPLYRKMIDFGTLPNNDVKIVSSGVENIDHCHVNIGESMWTSINYSFDSPSTIYTLLHQYIKSVNTSSGGTISITTSTNAAEYKALICFEYTKKTD